MKPILLLNTLLIFCFTNLSAVYAEETVLISKGAQWEYLDNGSNQASIWRENNFNSSGWKKGKAQLGYGDSDESTVVSYGSNARNKYITSYFRYSFKLADASQYKSLVLNLLRDDGAVVYLNGIEVVRDNMPSGKISYQTTASSVISGSREGQYTEYTLAATSLRSGSNTLAVEIHQENSSSSDISFDLGLTGSTDSIAINISRGPYLQMGSSDAMTIRWRTKVATNSQVRYGTRLNSLNQKASSTTQTTEHEIRLTGLVPQTRYYYSIGNSKEVFAGGSSYKFETSPTTGKREPTRVWVIGDSGTANSNAKAVYTAYKNETGSTYTDLWLMLGDNAYDKGTDSEYQQAVFDMYPEILRQTPLWSTLGNHDGYSSTIEESGPYYTIFTLPKKAEVGGIASGREAYYSFNHANIHFVVLDSFFSIQSSSQRTAMIQWLEADLQNSDADWTIAFWHHPPYSKGSHDSDHDSRMSKMRTLVLPILENYGVDLVLGGHSHAYERSKLIDRHYGIANTFNASHEKDAGSGRINASGAYHKKGISSHSGTVYVVAGSSGKVSSSGSLNHNAMFLSLRELGSMILEVNGLTLNASFLNSDGNKTDYFTLTKEGNSNTDSDNDGVFDDKDNCIAIANPKQENYDQDKLGNACDLDDDNDGMPDSYEKTHNLNPLDGTDAAKDADNDGFSNLKEFQAKTDPNDANSLPKNSLGCGLKATTGHRYRTITSTGKSRQYYLSVPTNYDKNKAYQLVFGFHGRDYDGIRMRDYLRLESTDYSKNTVFVYPNALRRNWSEFGNKTFTGWLINPYNNEDFTLFSDILAEVEQEHCIDKKRVYVTGQSWGGDFASALSCQFGDVIAATTAVGINGDFFFTGRSDYPKKYPTLRYSDCKNPVPMVTYRGVDDALKGGKSSDWWYGVNQCKTPAGNAVKEKINTNGTYTDSDCSADNLYVRYSNTSPYMSGDDHQIPKAFENETMRFFSRHLLSSKVPKVDSDADGIKDTADNCPTVANPKQVDTDNDNIGNRCDLDDDNDGMPDQWELRYGLNPLSKNDATADKDSDGLGNLQEFKLGTNPTKTDTDGDGRNDKEDKFPTDPKVFNDSDSDGIGDKLDNCPNKANKEQKDSDNDGIGDVCEKIATQSQIVEVSSCSAMQLNSIVTCQIQYTTTDNEINLSGLGLHLYYDNSRLTLLSINNILSKGLTVNDTTPLSDSNNGDADPKTNQYLRFSWEDTLSSWPDKTLPAVLFTLRFKVNATLVAEEATVIRFSASKTANGYSFTGKPHKLRIKEDCRLDIDDNNETKALTDGLLILRYSFGFRGETLIQKAIGENAKRNTAIAIENYLAGCINSFDIDDNGEMKALTDGLLILRYLFDFTGDTLINKAVGEGAKRKTAVNIETYLETLK